MENEKIQQMMIKFLYRYYPVTRHKINNKFRRCILFDDGTFFQISNKTDMYQLEAKLIKTLQTVFKCDPKTCKNVLNQIL